jgi:hypothetical protein
MTWSDILTALGGVAGLVAIGAFIGRNIVEKMADGALKRFEHSLQTAQANHQSMLAQAEADHQAKLTHAAKINESLLTRAEELHKSSVAFSTSIDTDLRARRIAMYEELWRCTGLIPLWPRNPALRCEDIATLSTTLKEWYFGKGGMYLSGTARKSYGDVQETIHNVLAKSPTGAVSGDDYEEIRKRCSTLRTELTEDLLSRREAPRDDAIRPSDPSLAVKKETIEPG